MMASRVATLLLAAAVSSVEAQVRCWGSGASTRPSSLVSAAGLNNWACGGILASGLPTPDSSTKVLSVIYDLWTHPSKEEVYIVTPKHAVMKLETSNAANPFPFSNSNARYTPFLMGRSATVHAGGFAGDGLLHNDSSTRMNRPTAVATSSAGHVFILGALRRARFAPLTVRLTPHPPSPRQTLATSGCGGLTP